MSEKQTSPLGNSSCSRKSGGSVRLAGFELVKDPGRVWTFATVADCSKSVPSDGQAWRPGRAEVPLEELVGSIVLLAACEGVLSDSREGITAVVAAVDPSEHAAFPSMTSSALKLFFGLPLPLLIAAVVAMV